MTSTEDVQSLAVIVAVFGLVTAFACSIAPRTRGLDGRARSGFMRASLAFGIVGVLAAVIYVSVWLSTGTTYR